MNYKKKIANEISKYIGKGSEEVEKIIILGENDEMGDYIFPCFKLASTYNKSPNIVAQELKGKISLDFCENIDISGVYLNFFIKKELIIEDILTNILTNKELYWDSEVTKHNNISIDYSYIDIDKPMTLAGMNTTVVGGVLQRVFTKLKYNVIGINAIGTRGIRFKKLIDEEEGLIGKEIFYENKVAERKKQYEQLYDKINIRFNECESKVSYVKYMNEILKDLNEKGILVSKNDAKVVDLKEFNMPPYVVYRDSENGLEVSPDLAILTKRYEKYNLTQNIKVIDYTKSLYYKQLFKVSEVAGYNYINSNIIVETGIFKFVDEELFNREVKCILLDDLINKCSQYSRKLLEEKDKSLLDIDKVDQMVAIGAIVFSCLNAHKKQNVNFSFHRYISFEGDTSLYIQYVHLKGQRLIKRNKKSTEDLQYSKLNQREKFRLIKKLGDFKNILYKVSEELDVSIIAKYLLEITVLLNTIYNDELDRLNVDLCKVELMLIDSTCRIIKECLELMGIEVLA